MRVRHDRVRRVLAGADDEPRVEGAAGNDEWIIVHGHILGGELSERYSNIAFTAKTLHRRTGGGRNKKFNKPRAENFDLLCSSLLPFSCKGLADSR